MNKKDVTNLSVSMQDIEALLELAPIKFHGRSCANCRYYREHETGAVSSECLMHGRTLGITTADNRYNLIEWARGRVCDLWSRRPKTWMVFSKGTENNPHWHDPYLPREVNIRRRKRILQKGEKNESH